MIVSRFRAKHQSIVVAVCHLSSCGSFPLSSLDSFLPKETGELAWGQMSSSCTYLTEVLLLTDQRSAQHAVGFAEHAASDYPRIRQAYHQPIRYPLSSEELSWFVDADVTCISITEINRITRE